MTVTLTAIVWMPLLLYAVIKKSISILITITIMSFIFQSASVFLVGDSSIDVMLFTSLVFDFLYFMRYKKIKKFKNDTLWLILLLLISALSILGAVFRFHDVAVLGTVNAYTRSFSLSTVEASSRHFTMFVPFCVYCITYIFFDNLTFSEKLETRIFNLIVTVVLIFGLWQWLDTNKIVPETILKELIYSNTAHWNSIAYGKEVESYNMRVFSTFSEPSYCGVFLAASFWSYVYRKRNKMENFLMFMCLVELVVNLSGSGIAAFFAGSLYTVFFIKGISHKKKLNIIGVAIIGLIIALISGFGAHLIDYVSRKFMSVSFFERSLWNEYALKAFKDTFGLGAGYGSLRASGIIQNILGQIGLFGLLCYIVFWLKLEKITKNIPELGIFIVAVLGAQISSCADLTLSTFWIGAYLVKIRQNQKRSVVNDRT